MHVYGRFQVELADSSNQVGVVVGEEPLGMVVGGEQLGMVVGEQNGKAEAEMHGTFQNIYLNAETAFPQLNTRSKMYPARYVFLYRCQTM